MSAQETAKVAGGSSLRLFEPACWLGLAVYLALVIGFAWNPNPLAQALAAIGILAALVHAALFYGSKDSLALFAICVVITFVMENIGATTGFPFGHYHFEVGANLPHIGVIPVIVGPLWFGMGYFSWHVAAALLGVGARPGRKFERFALPLVAAFVMTQWDVVMEPAGSTIAKAWIWHDGGAHFGVPLSNYAGWLLTSWLFYQVFAIYLGRRPGLPEPSPTWGRTLRLVAIAFYLSSGLTHLTPWLIGQSGDVVDAAGQLWRIGDLRATAVVTMLFTMFFTSVLAALRLVSDTVGQSVRATAAITVILVGMLVSSLGRGHAETQFLQSSETFEKAIRNRSTHIYVVFATIVNDVTRESHAQCVPARLLLGAIHREHDLSYDAASIEKAIKIALENPTREFHFSKQAAINNIPLSGKELRLKEACDLIKEGKSVFLADLTGQVSVDPTK